VDRLQHFLNVDNDSRDRAALISMAAGFVFGLLAKLFGYPFEVSAYGAAFIVCASYFCQAWLYCHRRVRTGSSPLVGRRWYLMATGFASLLLAVLPEQSIEAAVLDQRLLKLARGPILTAPEAAQVTDALDTAGRKQLALSSTAKVRVRDVVKNSALQNPHPPFTDAADALVKYAHDVRPPVGSSDAEAALQRAMAYDTKIAPDFTPENLSYHLNRAATEAAISELTRAIELAGMAQYIKQEALLQRANLYVALNQPDRALADLDAAERLGAVDLSEIVSTQAGAFQERGFAEGRRDDLRQAVDLFTLALQLPVPKALAADALRYRIGLYGERSQTNYSLMQYTAVIEDCMTILALLKQYPRPFEIATLYSFVVMIRSYLKIGDATSALKAAEQWRDRVPGDDRALHLLKLLRTDPIDALNFLNSIPVS
jgi:tetratricopeptide (TPR) repeat protein